MRWTLMFVLSFVTMTAVEAQQDAPPRSVWDGVYTFEQADRGKRLYASYCAYCHMPDLTGQPIDPRAGTATRSLNRAPALVGSEFISKWVARTVGDVFERTRISMPQDAPGSLTRRQNADITAFLLNANGYPAGLSELSDIKALLDVIVMQW